VQPILAAKWLTDRHTSTLEQEMLTDFIREGHFERHLRRSRTRNAALRAALLEALDAHLGSRISISGANAGIHLLIWLHDVAPQQLETLIAAAARLDVGLYAVTPYYMTPPSQAGLLLGYAAMTETDIRNGVARLARVLDQQRQRRYAVDTAIVSSFL
jgi:GntR family transcriptional regulator/MocR family aminotransferase